MIYDIITVGSATLDVFATTNNELIEIKTKKNDEKLIAYPLGSKILINKINFEIGGGGTNTAVCASRIGLKTAYLGNIGNDSNGKEVLEILKKEKVDFIGSVSSEMTNYSIILDTKNDDRSILVYKGASEKFNFKNIDKKRIKAKWIYLCAMVDKGYKELEKIAKFAFKNNIKIAFNPSSYLAEKGSKYLSKILKITNTIILNKEEAIMLVGNNPNKELVKLLSNLGPKNVVITNGKKKITILYDNKISEFIPSKGKINETTGAGDAFGATLISGLILKNDIAFATKIALKNSKSVIMQTGAKNGLLKRKDLLP